MVLGRRYFWFAHCNYCGHLGLKTRGGTTGGGYSTNNDRSDYFNFNLDFRFFSDKLFLDCVLAM